MLNGPEGLADGMAGGGTGSNHRKGRALSIAADRDGASGHIADHHGYHEGGDPLPCSIELVGFRYNGVDAADTASHINSQPFRRNVFFSRLCRKAAVTDSFFCSGDSILCEQIVFTDLGFFKMF